MNAASYRQSWLIRVARHQNRLYGITDITPDGRRCYFFILVLPSQENELKQALSNGQAVDLTLFGQIVASGYGTPSVELSKRLEDAYG